MRADLYRALARLSFTPPDIDGMEVWQVAALLGMDLKPELDTDAETFLGRPLREGDKRRLAKFAQSGGDGEDITAQVMRQMGIVTQ